jgi:hypothetical protein
MSYIASSEHQRLAVAKATVHAAGLINVQIRENGYQMNSGFIKRVGELIKKGTIPVWLTSSENPEFKGGWKGGKRFYAMILKTTPNPKGKIFYASDVVHEATHLGFAVQASGGKSFVIDALDDEAMAFTVQAIYLHKRGVLASEYVDDGFLTAAHAVAREILSKTGQSAIDKKVAELKRVLHDDPHGYKNEKREYFDPGN